jgi:hypothetical protein
VHTLDRSIIHAPVRKSSYAQILAFADTGSTQSDTLPQRSCNDPTDANGYPFASWLSVWHMLLDPGTASQETLQLMQRSGQLHIHAHLAGILYKSAPFQKPFDMLAAAFRASCKRHTSRSSRRHVYGASTRIHQRLCMCMCFSNTRRSVSLHCVRW